MTQIVRDRSVVCQGTGMQGLQQFANMRQDTPLASTALPSPTHSPLWPPFARLFVKLGMLQELPSPNVH